MALVGIDHETLHKKDITYLSKDFSQFRRNLIEYAKTYFPDTYNDFNDASPGMMMIEMSAFVGDVLSFYIDDSVKEGLLPYAQERKNVINLAQFFGYKVKPITPAKTRMSVYQLVPSTGAGENNVPDFSYALRIKGGMEIESTTDPNVRFRTEIPIDFGFSSSFDHTNVTVYSRDPTSSEPLFYLLKKHVDAISGTEKTTTFSIGSAEEYKTLTIDNDRVVEITSVTDSDNRTWYEVPFLAQDFAYVEYENSNRYDTTLSEYNSSVPFLLRMVKTPRRFVTRLKDDGNTELQFGAGTSSDSDQILIPSPKDIGLGNNAKSLSAPIDPQNFFSTRTYGQVPSNTTLTVKYLEGGGLSSNVQVNDLTNIRKVEFENFDETFTTAQLATVGDLKQSLSVTNAVPATGGRDEEPLDNIRNDAIAYFASQQRAVTKRDYEIRSLSMPPRFGGVAKVIVSQDSQADALTGNENEKYNPFAINMYVLGYDANKRLVNINDAIKENLKTYLSEYRMVTDGVNLLNGFVVDIGVDFIITTFRNVNKNETLLKSVNACRNFFNIDNWTFNQPINISELELAIASIQGVASVQDISIRNLSGGLYSSFSYNIDRARRGEAGADGSTILGKIIYPSKDPMIWQVRYPSKDIRGRAL
jgi:hypothetical protein